MNEEKGKFLKSVLIILYKVFFVSFTSVLLVTSFFAVYRFAYLKGFLDGQRSMDKYLAEVFTLPDATSIEYDRQKPLILTPSITPFPKKVSQGVTWGGVELWEEVNRKRVEYGVNPLKKSDELCTIASIRLNELLNLGKLDNHEGFGNFSERRPDLKWIFEKYSVLAEFLAYGGLTPTETVNLWDNTLGHKKLLNGGEYVWGCIYAQNTFAVAITAY